MSWRMWFEIVVYSVDLFFLKVGCRRVDIFWLFLYGELGFMNEFYVEVDFVLFFS